MEAVRAMLHDQDLPMHLWAKAARTTVYVHNHTPHRVLENKTLEEVFFWKETISHPSQNIRLSCIHTHSKRKEDKVRSLWKEGYICGII